jgi:hypothetical protein
MTSGEPPFSDSHTTPHTAPGTAVDADGPIGPNTVAGYRWITAIHDQLSTFIELVREDPRLDALAPGQLVTGPAPGQWRFPLFVRWPLLAAIDPDYGAFIAIEVDRAPVSATTGEPVLRAGYYFVARETRIGLVTRLVEEIADRDEPTNRHTTIVRDGNEATCVATLGLAELPPTPTLLGQARFAVAWATGALAFFSTIGAP